MYPQHQYQLFNKSIPTASLILIFDIPTKPNTDKHINGIKEGKNIFSKNDSNKHGSSRTEYTRDHQKYNLKLFTWRDESKG